MTNRHGSGTFEEPGYARPYGAPVSVQSRPELLLLVARTLVRPVRDLLAQLEERLAPQPWNERAQDVLEVQQEGARSLREIAAALNARGITTPNGGPWHATSVKRLLDRVSA